MILAKSREKGMSIRFFHMLHFILPCLVMSNICYMHTLDKVSTSGNLSSVLQGYDRTCYVIPWGRMDVPWPPYCAPEGDPFNLAHVLPCHTMVVAAPAEAPYGTCFTLVILMLSFIGFAACLRDIDCAVFWNSWDCVLNHALFFLLFWGYAHARTFFSRMIIDIS